MKNPASHFYEFGPFRLNATERLLRKDGEVIALKPKVVNTLLALVENSGRLVEKDELMRIVWPDTAVEENNLSQNISALRKALGEGQNSNRYIETVPRRGHRFVAPVVERWEDDADLVLERHTLANVVIEEEEREHESNLVEVRGRSTLPATVVTVQRSKINRRVVVVLALSAGLTLA